MWVILHTLISLQSVQFSLVSQSCLTLCDRMNHSTPGLSVHEMSKTACHFVLQGIFLTQGSNLRFLCLLYWFSSVQFTHSVMSDSL